MEDPSSGADLGKAGAFSWHDEVPPELVKSFERAMKNGRYDNMGGGHYYWDEEERLFWSWDTPGAIKHKVHAIVEKSALGGVFAWGLGEDAPRFEHLRATNEVVGEWASRESQHEYAERSEL